MDRTLLDNNEYSWCFACGKENEHGLHMRFEIDDDKCTAYFTPRREHQSYTGRMHGGLVAVLLDEVTGNYLYCKEGKPSYTAKIEHTVNPKSAQYIYDNLGTSKEAKELVWFEKSGHILTLDCEHEKVFKTVADFFEH